MNENHLIEMLRKRIDDRNQDLLEAQRRYERETDRGAHHLAALVGMGVRIGEPVEAHKYGCSGCVWHIEGPGSGDGGVIQAIRSWVEEGYLGDPQTLTLHPVIQDTTRDLVEEAGDRLAEANRKIAEARTEARVRRLTAAAEANASAKPVPNPLAVKQAREAQLAREAALTNGPRLAYSSRS